MPKEQNNIGTWNDWIGRQDSEKQEHDRFNAGSKQERKPDQSREYENSGAEKQIKTDQEQKESFRALILELEQNLKKYLNERLEQFFKTQNTTGDSGAQT